MSLTEKRWVPRLSLVLLGLPGEAMKALMHRGQRDMFNASSSPLPNAVHETLA